MVIPFLGRDEELRDLRAHFDAACARNLETHDGPRFVLVAAESGVGKSRLVQQLYHQLTTDPHWDPPEVDYWPDAFGDVGEEVRVNPEMQGHKPNGPARFFWLGVSWTEPGERKAPSDRALTALKHVLDLHVGVRERGRFRPASFVWNIATEVVTEATVGGFAKLAIGATREFWSNLNHRNRTIADEEHAQALSVTEELLGSFQSVLEGRNSIPIVLWLDDAHWIDNESTHFIRRLWTLAKNRRWPLLIVATHWEREWREQVRANQVGDDFKAQLATCMGPRFHTWELHGIQDATLRLIAAKAFPGLSLSNLNLLVDRACSNCLTMMENIGELKQFPANFFDRDLNKDLSEAGHNKVRSWKKDRSQRANQRFRAIGDKLQDLLGWSSRLGQRFLFGVVTDFAAHVRALPNAGDLLEDCIDPYAILARPSKLTRQFRDKAFYHVARSHFDQYSHADEQELKRILRRHLVIWINDSFDPDGEFKANEGEEGSQSAGALSADGQREELRDLLDMARVELPLFRSCTHLRTEDLAGLRARALAIVNDASEQLYLRAQELAIELEHVEWTALPCEALGLNMRSRLADTCYALAKHALAANLQRSVVAELHETRPANIDPSTPRPGTVSGQAYHDHRIIDARNSLTQYLLEIDNGLGEAIEISKQTLELARRLYSASGTDQSLDLLAAALTLAGRIHSEETDYNAARHLLEEALAIRSELAAYSQAPERRRDRALSMLEVCDIWSRGGEQVGGSGGSDSNGQRRELLEEGLNVMRDLVSGSPTQTNLVDLARALESHGRAHRSLRSHVEALATYNEAQSIRRRLFEDNAAPNHGRALAKLLVQMGETLLDRAREIRGAQYQDHARGHNSPQYIEGAPDAGRFLAEALEIWQTTPVLFGDFDSLRQKGRFQELLGVAHHERGRIEEARTYYRGALDAFESLHASAEPQDVSSEVERLREALSGLQHECGSKTQNGDALAANELELRRFLQQLFATRSERYLSEALDIWQSLTDLFRDSESQRHKGLTQELLGIAYHELGHAEEAEAYYRGALCVFEAVHASAESRKSRSDVERLRELVSLFEHEDVSQLEPEEDCRSQSEDTSEAKELERQEILRQLKGTRAAVSESHGLAALLTPQFGFLDQGASLSRSRAGSGTRKNESKEHATLGRPHSAEVCPASSKADADSLELQGSREYAEGNLRSALELLIKAREERERLLHSASSTDGRESLICCLYGIGKLHQELGMYSDALKAFQCALDNAKAVFKESESGATLRVVAVLLSRLGDAKLAGGSHESALSYYHKSLTFLDVLNHGLETAESQQDVSLMLEKMGHVKWDSGNLDGALENFREAADAG